MENKIPNIIPGMDHHDEWCAIYKAHIFNAEQRVIYYKKLLQEIHKNASAYPNWFKDDTRDALNGEQRNLKRMLSEYKWHKEGIDPPFGRLNFE